MDRMILLHIAFIVLYDLLCTSPSYKLIIFTIYQTFLFWVGYKKLQLASRILVILQLFCHWLPQHQPTQKVSLMLLLLIFPNDNFTFCQCFLCNKTPTKNISACASFFVFSLDVPKLHKLFSPFHSGSYFSPFHLFSYVALFLLTVIAIINFETF